MLGQGPLYVSEVHGHGSAAITMGIHGHLISGEESEATEAITDALCGGSQLKRAPDCSPGGWKSAEDPSGSA